MSMKAAGSDANFGTTPSTQSNSIWLAYSPVSNRQAFVDALCALYYLPEQYKLAVLDADSIHEMPKKYRDLISRVKILNKTGLSEMATPFAFIRGDVDGILSHNDGKTAPTVVVTDKPEQYVKDNEWDGFTVPLESPEALASAILNITRNSVRKGLRLIKSPFAI